MLVACTGALQQPTPIASEPPTTWQPPAPTGGHGVCTSRFELQPDAGNAINCYPYRCTPDGCVAFCDTRADCSYEPDDKSQWPLSCQSHHCVPFMRGPQGEPME